MIYPYAGAIQQERSLDGETKAKEGIWMLLSTSFGAIAEPHSCLHEDTWS